MLGAVFGLEMTRPLSADEVNKCTDLNCLSDIVQDGEPKKHSPRKNIACNKARRTADKSVHPLGTRQHSTSGRIQKSLHSIIFQYFNLMVLQKVMIFSNYGNGIQKSDEKSVL